MTTRSSAVRLLVCAALVASAPSAAQEPPAQEPPAQEAAPADAATSAAEAIEEVSNQMAMCVGKAPGYAPFKFELTVETDAGGGISNVKMTPTEGIPAEVMTCVNTTLAETTLPAELASQTLELGAFSLGIPKGARTDEPAEGAPDDGAPPPEKKKGKVIYKGSLSKAAIESTLKTKKSAVRFCYEKELKDRPDLKGTVVMRFVVLGSGKVRFEEPSLVDPGMEEVAVCVTQALASLQFPKPRGGGQVVVNYPYRFSPAPKTTSDAAAEAGLPPPDKATPKNKAEPSYFSQCCGCIP
jgi:hypothetical protein